MSLKTGKNGTAQMIEAIGNFVLVEMPPKETKSKGGIIIPEDTADKQHRAVQSGVIRSVGHTCSVVAGAMVGRDAYFGRYAGILLEGEEAEYRLIDEDEIRGIG